MTASRGTNQEKTRELMKEGLTDSASNKVGNDGGLLEARDKGQDSLDCQPPKRRSRPVTVSIDDHL